MTVTEAFALRKKLVEEEGRGSITAGVIGQIIRGGYRNYKEPELVAQGDIDYLKQQEKDWEDAK